MIELDVKKFKSVPFAHQVDGVKALLKNPAFALYDEMGAGKSKQVIDAACVLAEGKVIDTVLVIAPASVRCVWTDDEIGEVKKHSWLSADICDFHAKNAMWRLDLKTSVTLQWVVTNYEFLRSPERLKHLLYVLRNRKILLVLDEASKIKTRTAKQTKAIQKVRDVCNRCVILNGTPVTDSPMDLWSQMKVLDPMILGRRYTNFYQFRANYAVMGGYHNHQIVKFVNIDKLSNIVKPFVLRREKKDCLDLPPKLYTQREVALTPESWKRYKELRKECIINLGPDNIQIEPNAAVRIMRLAQLTSGILGTQLNPCDEDFSGHGGNSTVQDLSDEKLEWAIEYLLVESKARAIIVWTRWRRERERLVELLTNKIPVFEIYGGQSKEYRERTIQNFSRPLGPTDSRRILVAQPHAGGFGLNLVAATEVLYLSNDYSLGVRLQSEDRCHRPGQSSAVTYIDVIATGPDGQKTVDQAIVKALREKQHVARWTTDRWRKELSDDF